MDDQSLNRELESALDMDPSPEFLARVRTRIASEPAPSRWRLAPRNAVEALRQTRVMAPVAAAATVMLTVAVLRPFDSLPLAQGEPMEPVARPVAFAEAPGLPAPVPPVAPRRTRVMQRAVAARVEPPPFPEVIVAADQQRAFQVLVGLLRKGQMPQIPLEASAADAAPDAAAETPALEITPITIEELPVLAIASTEGEENP